MSGFFSPICGGYWSVILENLVLPLELQSPFWAITEIQMPPHYQDSKMVPIKTKTELSILNEDKLLREIWYSEI